MTSDVSRIQGCKNLIVIFQSDTRTQLSLIFQIHFAPLNPLNLSPNIDNM